MTDRVFFAKGATLTQLAESIESMLATYEPSGNPFRDEPCNCWAQMMIRRQGSFAVGETRLKETQKQKR